MKRRGSPKRGLRRGQDRFCAGELGDLAQQRLAKEPSRQRVEAGGEPHDVLLQAESGIWLRSLRQCPLAIAPLEKEAHRFARGGLSHLLEVDLRVDELRLVARVDRLRQIPGRGQAPRQRLAAIDPVERVAAKLAVTGALVAAAADEPANDRRPVRGARAREAARVALSRAAGLAHGGVLRLDQGGLDRGRVRRGAGSSKQRQGQQHGARGCNAAREGAVQHR